MSSTEPRARRRREYTVVTLALAAGAGLLLAAAGRVWATGEIAVPGPVEPVPVELTGGDLTGVLSGIGWAGLAAVVGLYAARGWARRVVGALVCLGGAGALAAVWNATRTDALVSELADRAADGAGAAQITADPRLLLLGPLAAGAGALLVTFTGVVAVVRSPAWPGMGTRYDRDAAPRPNRADTPADLWRSLDAGDDPTLDARGGDAAADAGRADTEGGTAPAPLAARPAEPKENH
ncbi:Trp biosynthesis-associated membrane protein [Nocardiopsis sp. FIRDI 009]|uniref:Trp biosynthesis-associated membrane protein n=1 Tax=Nocardiopsis sp. FIRDI 009 TaxID=714197 RepID=UPI000E238B1A|nr:Trp biosynthesis-associated membrane protein [Nocardiopsis sp. FIRDI 009]